MGAPLGMWAQPSTIYIMATDHWKKLHQKGLSLVKALGGGPETEAKGLELCLKFKPF